MTGAQAGAVVSMKILVEQDIVPPVRIALEFLNTAVHGPPPRFIAQEDPSQTVGDFTRHFEQIHLVARAGGALDFKVVAIVEVERQQSADEERVQRHPDGTTPVGVTSEHAGFRFRRKIAYPVTLASHREDIRVMGVMAGQCPYSVGTQKLVLIEHAR